MLAISLSLQLLAVSSIILKRQTIHESVASRQSWYNTYDYIVVGAGAAGSVIAKRLTEDKSINVILLEAGGPQHVCTDIPRNARSLLESKYDWAYKTVPQKWFTPYRVPEPRGFAIGGSTTINNMMYNRGNRKDFDFWAEEFGAKGWEYNNFLKYFIKSENNTDPFVVLNNPGYHGTNGPVAISSNPSPDPILHILQDSLKDFGVDPTDINGRQQLGSMIAQSFIGNGIRSSTGNEYLEPFLPENLHLLTNAFVTKILFKRINGKLMATGVEFKKNGQMNEVFAIKEVIICAGAFNSPQLLMLSGIGPKDHLTQMGIPVLADLPVGNNLQDHPTISIHMLIKDSRLAAPPPQLNVDQLYKLLKKGEGPLSMLTPAIFFYTTSSIADKEWPNTYTYSVVEYVSDLNITVRELPDRRERWKQYFKPLKNHYLLLTSPHLSRVRSYGTLRLASTDPFTHPIIDPQFLAHPQDYADMIEITKFLIYFLTESRLSSLLSILPEPIPGCSYCADKKLYNCDSYVKCLIRETIKTGYHPVGTCRMGSIDRKDVVVDERLRVKNVDRLRVCDASIMPQVVNANTNPASIAIGEKAADLIKEDNRF